MKILQKAINIFDDPILRIRDNQVCFAGCKGNCGC